MLELINPEISKEFFDKIPKEYLGIPLDVIKEKHYDCDKYNYSIQIITLKKPKINGTDILSLQSYIKSKLPLNYVIVNNLYGWLVNNTFSIEFFIKKNED